MKAGVTLLSSFICRAIAELFQRRRKRLFGKEKKKGGDLAIPVSCLDDRFEAAWGGE